MVAPAAAALAITFRIASDCADALQEGELT
jgi:hypothetical protein